MCFGLWSFMLFAVDVVLIGLGEHFAEFRSDIEKAALMFFN